ncbi:MAG: flavin reductase [Mesorhizobium sp.]|nr:flavin reductase [Mesorhizobium sp.]
MLKQTEIQPQDYRDAMAKFAGAVHVITTDGPAGRRGVTVIAACSVSDDPPTILVCLNRLKTENDVFAENGVFALNTLAEGHIEIGNAFSGLGGLTQDERFALSRWDTLASGAPALVDALTVLDCRIVETKDMATHRIHFGRVVGVRIGAERPALMYHERSYKLL